jgi:hypothetical protein
VGTDDLFKKIREGDKEDSREVFDNLIKGHLRGAIVSIISRNFSHSLGKVIKK